MTRPVLGSIADDFTGATDLALMLKREGMRVVQLIGVPDSGTPVPEADAVVIALKIRTVPPRQAVDAARASLEWLQAAGAEQIYYKYCSTFDSTPEGNIGPVTETLLSRLDDPITVACPAFPDTGRTVYQGHLFVNGVPLHESPLRDHPLTPMTDSNLVRVLARQTALSIANITFDAVERGVAAVRAELQRLAAAGTRIAVVDALTNAHLRIVGAACKGLRLVTGGSGLAQGIPGNFRLSHSSNQKSGETDWREPGTLAAVLAGSCSAATREQVAQARQALPSFRLDPAALAEGEPIAQTALSWALDQSADQPVLIYSSATPDEVHQVQERYGRDRIGGLLEEALAEVAAGLVDEGVRRLVVAGGETSGAVVERLGVNALEIGPEIDPGVPWTRSRGRRDLLLALKSGNFGAPDFFLKALRLSQ